MSDFLRNLSDKALLELREARGDIAKLSTESLEEIRLAKDINKPLPSLRDMQVKNTPAWQSAAMGAANTMSMGLVDEVGGAARAASQNVLSKFTDSAKPTTWEAETQRLREGQEIAQEANPRAFLGGQIGGGLVSPALMTAKAGTGILTTGGINAAASTLAGGLQRAGDAEGAGERVKAAFDPASVATDFTIGGALGMGGAAIAKGVRGAKSGDLMDGVADYAGALGRGAKTEGTVGKVIDTTKELMATAKGRAEAASIAAKGRQMLGLGIDPKFNLSDRDVIEIMLTKPGDNIAKQWVAKRTSTELGIPRDRYQNLLNMTGEETAAARRFNKDEAGKQLAGQLGETLGGLEKTKASRVSDLTEQARARFTGEGADEVLAGMFERSAMGAEDGASSLQKAVGRTAEESRKLLEEGRGLPSQGLAQGDFTTAQGSEQFKRLQKTREYLDSQIDWEAIRSKKRQPTPEEREFMTLRSQIDDVLKTSPEKIEADRLVSDASGMMRSLRKAVMVDGEVDQYKVARMLADTDNAKRFRDALPELQDYADRLGDAEGGQAKQLIEAIQQAVGKAEVQRDIGKFKMETVGPSGSTLERLSSFRNKNRMMDDALQNPDLFLKRREAVNQLSMDMFKKPFDKLGQEEKLKLIRQINKSKLENGGFGE